jgi:hypothetical protein
MTVWTVLAYVRLAMGALFNTPGTQGIIQILSKTFTHNFSTAAANTALVADLANAGISSWRFASAYGLVAVRDQHL